MSTVCPFVPSVLLRLTPSSTRSWPGRALLALAGPDLRENYGFLDLRARKVMEVALQELRSRNYDFESFQLSFRQFRDLHRFKVQGTPLPGRWMLSLTFCLVWQVDTATFLLMRHPRLSAPLLWLMIREDIWPFVSDQLDQKWYFWPWLLLSPQTLFLVELAPYWGSNFFIVATYAAAMTTSFMQELTFLRDYRAEVRRSFATALARS